MFPAPIEMLWDGVANEFLLEQRLKLTTTAVGYFSRHFGAKDSIRRISRVGLLLISGVVRNFRELQKVGGMVKARRKQVLAALVPRRNNVGVTYQ